MSKVCAFEQQPCVGLFGTCGSSTFRQELFIPEYEARGINYFNPQVDDWKPELADIEADHLAFDVVQCWPVTGETYGTGSLAEQGYSIAASLRSESPLPKFVIPMIEMDLSDSLTDEVARKESVRARKLAASHMALSASPNIFIVDSLEEMLETSITLYEASLAIVSLTKSKNPAYSRYVRAAENRQTQAKELERLTLQVAAIK